MIGFPYVGDLEPATAPQLFADGWVADIDVLFEARCYVVVAATFFMYVGGLLSESIGAEHFLIHAIILHQGAFCR